MKKYDYLIVGSGLFGAVFAHEATKKGKKTVVAEQASLFDDSDNVIYASFNCVC